MAYKGKYRPKNLHKYKGDPDKVRFLSLWERSFMIWLDKNDDVRYWNSEDVHIKYICKTDGKEHTYMVDFYVEYTSGKKEIIEIKPAKQTVEPKRPKKTSKKYLTEQFYYAKNVSKWTAAVEFAKINNIGFRILTEISLREMGIKIL